MLRAHLPCGARIHAPLLGYAVSKRDIGASVRQRLLNQAHKQGRPFQELLQYFVMERFLPIVEITVP